MGDELTIKEVMEILNVSRPTVYKLISQGHLHKKQRLIGLPHGQRFFFDRAEVEQLKAKIETPAPVQPKRGKK